MFSIYHMTLGNHMLKELCDFMGGSFSEQVTTLPGLFTLPSFPRDLARTRDQRTLGLSGRNLLIVYSYSAKFNSYTHSGIGYIILLVCHVIWQGHVIIWPCNLLFNILGSKPWSSVNILLSLEGRRVGGQVTLRAGAH